MFRTKLVLLRNDVICILKDVEFYIDLVTSYSWFPRDLGPSIRSGCHHCHRISLFSRRWGPWVGKLQAGNCMAGCWQKRILWLLSWVMVPIKEGWWLVGINCWLEYIVHWWLCFKLGQCRKPVFWSTETLTQKKPFESYTQHCGCFMLFKLSHLCQAKNMLTPKIPSLKTNSFAPWPQKEGSFPSTIFSRGYVLLQRV